jgi:tRNA1Val (adenine37-N6)-methyltransferase
MYKTCFENISELKMAKNQFFKFKQFTVWQENTAMKVSTDACLLGAFVKSENVNTILDIGTGTGLLALMAAQNHPNAKIDAVEIEENAFIQAKNNCKESPFANRINIYNTSIQEFNTNKKYDLIISNPPFFVNATKSEKHSKNIARHTDLLPFEDLIDSVTKFLNTSGKFYLLLPFTEMDIFIQLANNKSLFCLKRIEIADNENSSFHRVIAVFSHINQEMETEKFYIKNSNDYSAEFVKILKPFYLYL